MWLLADATLPDIGVDIPAYLHEFGIKIGVVIGSVVALYFVILVIRKGMRWASIACETDAERSERLASEDPDYWDDYMEETYGSDPGTSASLEELEARMREDGIID